MDFISDYSLRPLDPQHFSDQEALVIKQVAYSNYTSYKPIGSSPYTFTLESSAPDP